MLHTPRAQAQVVVAAAKEAIFFRTATQVIFCSTMSPLLHNVMLFTYAFGLMVSCKAQNDQSCTSCFVNEVQEVLKTRCAASGLAAAEDLLKEQMRFYLRFVLTPADIDAALSVSKNAGASTTKSAATEVCTECFDMVIEQLSNSQCDPRTCYVRSLAAAAQFLDWWVDQEAQCGALVSNYLDEAPTRRLGNSTLKYSSSSDSALDSASDMFMV